MHLKTQIFLGQDTADCCNFKTPVDITCYTHIHYYWTHLKTSTNTICYSQVACHHNWTYYITVLLYYIYKTQTPNYLKMFKSPIS